MRRRVHRPLAIAIGLALAGCAARRPPPRSEEVVRRIRFEGNDDRFWVGTTDDRLRSAMVQQASPRLAFLAPRRRQVPLDRAQLRRDAWRIERWYAHRGFLDARFRGWTIERRGRGEPPRVVITGRVEPGPPSTVRSLEWRGLSGPLEAMVRARAELREGARFDADAMEEDRELALEVLREHGFPLAEVEVRADAWPEEAAVDVAYEVRPGPPCRFGEVRFEGAEGLPAGVLHDRVAVEPGAPYRASALVRTRQQLYGLGAFSMVRVVPELDGASSSRIVPVTVELRPAPPRVLRLGAGFAAETGKADAHVSAGFRHVDLLGRLARLDLDNRVGYVALVGPAKLAGGLGEVEHGPAVRSELSVEVPTTLLGASSLGGSVTYELGVEEGYRFGTVAVAPFVRVRPAPRLTAELGYHLRYFDYIDLRLDPSEATSTRLGLDFTDPYLLSYLSQDLTHDSRDDPLFPRRGLFLGAGVDEAGGLLGGGYDYVRLRFDERVYRPLRRLLGWRLRNHSVAARVGGGWIVSYGPPDRARVPYAERLLVGGSGTVRGWTRNHLGPYLCDPAAGLECASDPATAEPTTEILPIGGLLALYGGAELRLYSDAGYGLALFADLGMAWEDLAQVREIGLQPAVGLGGRYRSPVGPVRLDVACRASDPPMFALEPRCALHFGIGEAY